VVRITGEEREAVRQRLLEEAAVHFARDGVERANINAIATAAGFGKGTIYNYFPSKEELFGEVLTAACERTVARYAASLHGETVRARLEALAAADVEVLRDDEAFMKVLIREAMSFRATTYPVVVQHMAPFLAIVVDILTSGVEAGEVRNDHPVDRLALQFVGTLAMLYVQHWGSGGEWPTVEELPSLAVSTFLDGART